MKKLWWIGGVVLVAGIIVAWTIYFFAKSTESEAVKNLNAVKNIDPALIVGQNMIAGITGPNLDAANTAFLEKVKPAGIVLYAYNITSRDALRVLISDVQKVAMRTTGVPYLMMIDEEPGGATRLGLFKDAFSTTVGANGAASTTVNWQAIGRDIGVLRDIGINVVLSPLADAPLGASKGSVTHRMPIQDPTELEAFNARFIAMLSAAHIGATLKHFPGLGVLAADTHVAITHATVPISTLTESEDIFKKGIQAGAQFVMTSHAIYDAVDSTRSASISPAVMSMLHDGLKFGGIAITDDVTNMPIGDPYRMQTDDVTEQALLAGHTLVLFGSRRDLTADTYSRLLQAYQNDSVPGLRTVMQQNYAKIIQYKKTQVMQ